MKVEGFHIGIAVCLLLIPIYILTQPRLAFKNGSPYDAGVYLRMAEQVHAGEPISGPGPFVYRIGLPWLVGTCFAHQPLAGFQILNIAFGLLTLALLIRLAQTQCRHRFPVAVVALLWCANPQSPFRMHAFYPCLTDAPALCCMLFVLVISQEVKEWHGALAVGMGLVSFTGVLFREIALLAPVAGLFAHTVVLSKNKGLAIGSLRQLAWHALPCLAAAAAWATTRWLAHPADAWSSLAQIRISADRIMNYPGIYAMAIFSAHGPSLLAIFSNLKPVARYFMTHQHWLVYGGGILLLALIGGNHTDRFMYWGFPAVLLALAVALDQFPFTTTNRRWTLGFFVPLGAAQALAFRVFATIPNAAFDFIDSRLSPAWPELFVFAPYGPSANASHIYAGYMDSGLRALMAHQYLALMAFVLAMLALRAWLPRPGPTQGTA